jgi:hypothetical protein
MYTSLSRKIFRLEIGLNIYLKPDEDNGVCGSVVTFAARSSAGAGSIPVAGELFFNYYKYYSAAA